LIELLIVVIVLAILAAIVVFALGTTRSDSVHSACSTSEKSLELSAEAINTKTGAYPAGTIISTTANNPLVVGGVTPSNGALLKTYPTSNDYSLQYVGAADGSSYAVHVFKGTTDIGAASNPPVTGQAACGLL
jgi:general secretion pathway protein G